MFHQNKFNMVIVQDNTLDYFLTLFKSAKQVFFDTETSGLSVRHTGKDYVVGYTFAFEDEVSKDVFYIPVRHIFDGTFVLGTRFKHLTTDYLKDFPNFHPEKFNGEYYNVDAFRFASELKTIMEGSGKEYIAHNIMYDLHVIANEGVDILKVFDNNVIQDTQVMVHTIDENVEKNLESVTEMLFRVKKSHYSDTIKTVTKEEKLSQGMKGNVNANFQHVQIPIGGQYSCEDVWFMKQMYPRLVQGLIDDEQFDIYTNSRIPFLKVLWKMERRGVRVDIEALDKMQAIAEREAENYKYRMYQLAGIKFNPDSSQHLYELLFGFNKRVAELKPEVKVAFESGTYKDAKHKSKVKKQLMSQKENLNFSYTGNKDLIERNFGFTPTEFTDGGEFNYDELKTPKTGKDVLKALKDQETTEQGKQFLKELVDYKKLSKLISAFMDGLREHIYEDGKVHCSFNLTGTDSWRLSSAYPNLQQLPKPLEEPKDGEDRSYYDLWSQFEIRKLFIADDGYVVIASDYHALEKFLTAHLSQDKLLLKMMRENLDPHGTVATLVFPELKNVHPNEVKKVAPDKRQISKGVGFALDYGGGAGTIARNLGINIKVAQGYVDKYFEGFYGLHAYDKAVVRFAKANGYVKTLGGHKRHVWDINHPDRGIASYNERVAVNVLSQGAGADCAMFAQIDIDSDPVLNAIGAYMVMNIHDEIVMMCPSEYAELCKERLVYFMEKCLEKRGINLTIPLEAVADQGHSYADAK